MSWIKGFLLSCLVAVAALVVAEILLNFFWSNPYENTAPSKVVELRMHSPNVSRKLNLSSLGKDIEVVFRVDNDRFIFPSNQHESPSKTIMFVGGSTTECSAVSESLRFPHYVSTLFKEDGQDINTINLGRSGNTLHDTINIFFNYAHLYRPDYLVIMHATNDGGVLEFDPDYSSRMAHEVLLKDVAKWFLQAASRLQIGGLLREALSNMRNRATQVAPQGRVADLTDSAPVDYQAFKARLEVMVTMARSFDVEPVLMTQPLSSERNVLTPSWSGYNRQQVLNGVIRDVAKAQSVFLIDLSAHMLSQAGFLDDPTSYLYDGMHVTDLGSIEYARAIHSAFQEILISK